MFLTNGFKAKLIKYNRKQTGVYDDEYKECENIIVCPYGADIKDNFGTYSTPEAEGHLIIKRASDVREGDQIILGDRTLTILKVKDNWIFNRIENYTVVVR